MTNEAFTPSPAPQETPQDTFGVEMRYNLNFLYSYLTQGSHRLNISLDNNLPEITEPGYDIFNHATIELTSDLKVKDDWDWPNRTDKKLGVDADLGVYRGIEFDQKIVPALMDALSSQGINTEYSSSRYYSTSQLKIKDAHPLEELWLELKKEKNFLTPGTTEYIYAISFGQPPIDLQSNEDIYTAITADTAMMEKVIRAFYQVEKKHLPTEKFVFAPKQTNKELQKWFASCPNCRRQYSILNGPECPGCGGSNPIIHYHE